MKNPGNKAANLKKLKEAGFSVPSFISLPEGTGEQDLLKKVKANLPGCNYFAVRSSAVGEDSGQKSYAGHYYSAIAVPKEKLFKEYQNVISSYKEMEGSVIIQEFVPANISGVLFTNEGKDNIVINANAGLCKTVVEGRSCDEYIVSQKGTILNSHIPKEKRVLLFRDGVVSEDSTSEISLTKSKIKKLVIAAQKIECIFGSPQDVEWGFVSNKLYILQSRPVTREIPKPREIIHYDSANIAESYSGIVLPLTLSFAKHIYKIVYENLVHFSGVSRRKLKKHVEVFNSMVGWFYGRLYYNMNSWYRMTSFIPGYKRNKENLENMITSNIHEEIDHTILPSFWLKIGYPFIVIAKLMFFNLVHKRFQKRVEKKIKQFRDTPIKDMPFHECLEVYKDLNKQLLSKWHIPVENDFLVMTCFGMLRKKLSEEELNKVIQFKSRTSTQINAIIKINKAIKIKHALREAVINEDIEQFNTLLNNHSDIQELLDNYYLEYGGRFANELKLESSDIEEDKLQLLRILNHYDSYKTDYKSIDNNLGPYPLGIRFSLKKFKKHATLREEHRLLRSNCFSIVRKIFLRVGTIYSEEGRIEFPLDIFYLTLDEIESQKKSHKEEISERKKEYENYRENTPPTFFSVAEGGMPDMKSSQYDKSKKIKGRACTSGKIKGRVKVLKEYAFPVKIDFDIVVTSHTDPGWTPLLALCKGLIIEQGGILSHAAIVSRELGIPTVIGAQHATKILTDGQRVEINGDSGIITILDEN